MNFSNRTSVGLTLFIKFFQLILSYFSYYFLSFVVVELFALIFVLVSGTSLEESFLKILYLFPTLTGKTLIGSGDVMIIFSIISFVFLFLSKLFKYIHFSLKYFLVFHFFLHLLSGIRLSSSEFVAVVILFYATSLFCFFIYYSISKFSTVMKKFAIQL